MIAADWGSPDRPVLVEPLAGSDRPAHYLLAETLDGLYAPYALRLPDGPGPHPFVLVAYGNGGGGMAWLHDRVHRFRHVTDVLLDAGYACAWVRYRTEVELGYQTGGPLRSTVRQGMGLMSRAPLEYEDEVAILRHVATHPAIDGERLFHVGVSHAGEMLFKLLSQYPGLLRAGVAAEPASHELLTLRLDDVPTRHLRRRAARHREHGDPQHRAGPRPGRRPRRGVGTAGRRGHPGAGPGPRRRTSSRASSG